MGKWAEVHCSCVNRRPLQNSDFTFDRTHRKKRRLTKKQRAEVEGWERTTKEMYEGGHRSGNIIELWPGEVIQLGNLVGRVFCGSEFTFGIFAKVGDWRCYDDELLMVQPNEAELWLLEIEEILRSLKGEGSLPEEKLEELVREAYVAEVQSVSDIQQSLDRAAERIPFSGVVSLRMDFQQRLRKPDFQSKHERIVKALSDAAQLCRASVETGNPIRLLW